MIEKITARLKAIPLYVFVAAFVVFALICVYSLRQNNLKMVELRQAVYATDEKTGDVNKALNNLRQYVYSHMNTNLSSGGNNIKPPIQLKYTYERLTAAAQQRTTDKNLYTAAENYCQAKIPASVSISGRGRISCVEDYILSHGGQKTPQVSPALYEFDFVSPTWSPDFAGWSLVFCGLLLILLIVRYLLGRNSRV